MNTGLVNLQHHPKLRLTVVYAPRVPRRLRSSVIRLCRKYEMQASEVIRYSFEAAVLNVPKNMDRFTGKKSARLDAILVVRTTRKIQHLVMGLWLANPNTLDADILRGLLEYILPIAEARGMAYVMKLRELALRKLSQ